MPTGRTSLSASEKLRIRNAFGEDNSLQAERLLADWPDIATAVADVSRTTLSSLQTPTVRRLASHARDVGRIDRALTKAVAELRQVEALGVSAQRSAPGAPSELLGELDVWSLRVRVDITQKQLELQFDLLTRWNEQSKSKPKRGNPAWPRDNILLNVVAAYFGLQGWRVTAAENGMFARVEKALLGKRTANHKRLRALSRVRWDARPGSLGDILSPGTWARRAMRAALKRQ